MAHKIGTDLDEDLIGSGVSDRLEGRGGKDRLYGKEGDDLLYGGAGDDQLIGGLGTDLMFGGTGNDAYEVDNTGDVVSEETSPGIDDGGVDTVKSSISFTLGAFIEKLQLTGTAAIDGAGNALANTLKGNDAANVLSGQAGSDTLSGGGGDDIMIGGADKDYLTGGTGSDTFVFGPPLAITSSKADKIEDFAAEDWLGIYAADYGLTEGNGLAGGALDASYFVNGPRATAIDHGQFVFNSTSALLMWDADGTGAGAAVPVAAFAAGAVVTANDFRIMQERPAVAIAAAEPGARAEDAGAIFFAITLSSPAREDVLLTYSTVDGTAVGGVDFVPASGLTLTVPAGSTTAYIKVNVLNDEWMEAQETFQVRIDSAALATSHQALTVTTAASGSILDEGPRVVAEHSMAALGIPDPSGLAYDPHSDTLFLSDSEIEETPFFQTTNLFGFGRDGTLQQTYSLDFTTEPTGLAFDPTTGLMFITDDTHYQIYCVDPASPQTLLWQFDARAAGCDDPEDIAVDPSNGHLFIVNGISRTIVETNNTGTVTYNTIELPPEIRDPEALAYDPGQDVFYVGGSFSANIWQINREGDVLAVIDELSLHRNQVGDRRAQVKDIELAPASDGSDEISLYVADYGWDQQLDGRLFEIDLGDSPPPPPPDWLLS